MNKWRLILFLWLLTAADIPFTYAQDGVTPPKAPFVATPPDGTSWSMEIEQRVVHPGGPTPKRMNRWIGKNHVQQVMITYTNSSTQQFYISGEHLLQKYDNSDKVAALPLEKDDPSQNQAGILRVAMFPGVDWIAAQNYEGIVTLNQHPCYKFHASGSPDLQAWIKTADSYPLQVQIGSTVYKFSEINAFPKNVDLPPLYHAALSAIQAEQQALDALKQLAK